MLEFLANTLNELYNMMLNCLQFSDSGYDSTVYTSTSNDIPSC